MSKKKTHFKIELVSTFVFVTLSFHDSEWNVNKEYLGTESLILDFLFLIFTVRDR